MPGVVNANIMSSNRDVSSCPSPNWAKYVFDVESVQELARKNLDSLPERYIRREDEKKNVSIVSDDGLDIPVIDMGKLSASQDRRGHEIHRLGNACSEWGFFQVVNHGISRELIDELRNVARQFFEQPLEEKQKYAVKAGDLQGYGQTFVVPNQKKFDWGDLLGLVMSPPQYRNYNKWPLEPSHFRNVVERYYKELKRVAEEVLSIMAQSLGLKREYFNEAFGDEYVKMRMNMYPACPWAEKVHGLSPHADMTGITLLLQDDNCVGLHVKNEEKWIAVKPIPYALVINVGNLVEVMTNGRFKSVLHRAVPNAEKDRMSIPFFYAPGFQSEIFPAPQLIDGQHPPLFRKFVHEDYMKYYFSRTVEGKQGFYDYASYPHE